MSTVLLLVRANDEPEGIVHIAIVMVGTPWNFSMVCEASKYRMQTLDHRKGFVPTCLNCVATLQNRYLTP